VLLLQVFKASPVNNTPNMRELPNKHCKSEQRKIAEAVIRTGLVVILFVLSSTQRFLTLLMFLKHWNKMMLFTALWKTKPHIQFILKLNNISYKV
jgi:hypothetical protein